MARRKTKAASLDFTFFEQLWRFYRENRGVIRRHYRDLTKKFLDFNNPNNANAFLRWPQFEALEMYIFLKEFLDNAPVHQIFRDWQKKEGRFENRSAAARGAQLDMFEELTGAQYEAVFARMRANARIYPNYIFALTMGTGKTILMATCIFYEFILANKFPKDPHYCHNALVFAPDKTVLQSLREIQTFHLERVVPPEYVNFLTTHIQFHFLDEAGTALSVLDRSRFNLIITNTQKIILKRQSTEKTPLDKLFGSGKPTYQTGSVYEANADLYGWDEPDDEASLTTNQRFEKLRRLEQLGIYVDEAHHAFGNKLAADMGVQKRKTSLRLTIDELAASLEHAGTHVVACYNYTGTPYVGQEVLPEVVYAYNLNDAIQNKYLKKVKIHALSNPKSTEFVRFAIDDFIAHYGHGQRYEGMLPKLAFFAATIDELQKELRPAVEKALARHNIPADRILINVGDDKLTSNDDIRAFNRLDTVDSQKQFILLVNKGREGWNCRSLFGVALYRKPRSKIFVLQATMRCLRAIGEGQQTGSVYLSAENRQILDDELQQNFRLTIGEVQGLGQDKEIVKVKVTHPPVKIKLKRIRHLYRAEEKTPPPGLSLNLNDALSDENLQKYRLIHVERAGLNTKNLTHTEDITHMREKREFTALTLVAEVARYLNKPCLEIETILANTREGITTILDAVNRFNELLYDWIIPRLFQALYQIREYKDEDEFEAELVKTPEDGYYQVSAAKDLIIRRDQVEESCAKPEFAVKSFHLDTYCFDSQPERKLFCSLLQDDRVSKVYFTGMLTHGQSDFHIQYIDPESHTVRTYYPDFLFQKKDGTFVIVEVKGDNKIDDPVVQAKRTFAEQMAAASRMTYKMIKGSDANAGRYAFLFNGEDRPGTTEVA